LAPIPIELDCEEVWRHLSDYIEDDVDVNLRASMELHFKGCAHCTAILDGTKNVVQLVGDGRSFDLPARMSQRLYAKLNQHLASQSNRKPRR
jgi:hypothetical protein